MKKFITIFIGSILLAFSYNWFLLPHKILSGGVAGISLITSLLTPANAGLINLLLNIPILIIGYLKLGKSFIFASVFAVITLSIAMYYLPIYKICHDPLLSSVFGGVISGVGIGIVFRSSGSTGGFDIIALLLTKVKDISLGNLFFILNGIVVLVSGFLFTWDLAFYTLVSIYVSSKVVDTVHTSHIKLTLTIVTDKGEEVKSMLLHHLIRGITELNGKGGYSEKAKTVLVMVITRYELSNVKEIILKVDPKAFVNITETVEVFGAFRKD